MNFGDRLFLIFFEVNNCQVYRIKNHFPFAISSNQIKSNQMMAFKRRFVAVVFCFWHHLFAFAIAVINKSCCTESCCGFRSALHVQKRKYEITTAKPMVKHTYCGQLNKTKVKIYVAIEIYCMNKQFIVMMETSHIFRHSILLFWITTKTKSTNAH